MRAVQWSCAALMAVAVTGCRTGRDPAAPVPVPAPSAAAAAQSATLPNDIRWVQRSAEYHAAIAQAYRGATTRVEQQAAGRAPGSWAVVLDADETVISNLQYQIERVGKGYSAESWAVWVRRREATPLPGASAFLARVRALGGRIAIVTNRLESECEDTAAVFRTERLVYDAMLCRPEEGPSDKNPRFDAVAGGKSQAAAMPLEIVAFVGDNIMDFPGLSQAIRTAGEGGFTEFGTRYFLVPNPMYGSWERTP